MLHIVNKSPFNHNGFKTCLKYAVAGSAVLLIEDGVYAGTRNTAVSGQLQVALKSVPIYALKSDVEARGMQERVLEGVQLVDYGGFVDLVAAHNTVQSWV